MNPSATRGNLGLVVVFRILLPLLVTGCGALGQSDNASPQELARRGDYREAARSLDAMVESGSADAAAVESLYYSWIRQGDYETAQRRFEELSGARPDDENIRLAAARSNRITGNYERGLEHLESVASSPDVGVAVLYEKAVLLEEVGRRDEASEIYRNLIRRFQNGTVRTGNDLYYVAQSLRAMEFFHESNDLLRVVTQQNPRHAEAFLAWGDLLAEKYNDPEAVASYEDALRIDPNMPEAHLGIAAVLADENPERSQQSLDRALEVNPNLIDGFLLRARQHIDAEQYDEADEETAKALEINPRSPAALSLLAATHYLRDDQEAFDRYVRQVLDINSNFSELYYTLAELCVSVRLYEQAVEFAREALRLNERDWSAMSLLGINLLRIGEEEEGKAALEVAYENDAFNVWTVNTLTLLDSFENFDRFETEHFEIKLHKEESGVLAPYVTELLEEAFTTLSSKYGFEPDTPITFEMFPDHEDFAVRTLGLPGLGALGVSFGKVVVMDSPSARPPEEFNWGGTLWHEFAHVITLGTTDHKIPRWFSEGISVYEERKAVPGWGEDLRVDYLAAINEGQFLPIAELNNGFVRPTNPGQVTLSYFQASLVCDYIDEMHGFDAILEMLSLYREGRGTEEVFQQALGMSLSAFDREFTGWVRAKVAFIDLEQFREFTLEGFQALEGGDFETAIEALTRAIEMYPEYTAEQNPYEMLAEAYVGRGDQASAIETLSQFSALSEYAYSTNLKLAGLMRESGDTAGAADILKRAMYIHPMDLEGHRELGAVLLEREDYAGAAREYGVLVELGAPDLANTYFNLASAQFGAGQLVEARRSILRCLEIAPSFEAAQELLLRIVR
jgi:tetratricopeptide (TPR) repeat protein